MKYLFFIKTVNKTPSNLLPTMRLRLQQISHNYGKFCCEILSGLFTWFILVVLCYYLNVFVLFIYLPNLFNLMLTNYIIYIIILLYLAIYIL